MRFWKRSRRPDISADDLKKAEILEAYTRWLKNERLSRKQKRLLKDVNSLTELQPLKQLIDFAHYRFEERENIMPRPGAEERAKARVMAEIRGEAPETFTADGLEPQLGYSPQGMGSETTEIMQVDASLPNTDEIQRWDAEQSTQTLSRLHVRFEQKDENVYVTDLGSSDATYIDNERVEKETRVQPGSTLKCGKVSFKVVNIKHS
ncbi:MAG: FHA domain-containing protein [Candidatus Poribacteria bacterium]|nr:FHA domain-containing protein [Candidatus Poribacteria bacterium]